ncbi:MFS transporter [Streptomyces sp. NPDC056144]|uniref:MFS transporter n=1 Tax=unclassified Streptomyces TaxID=2593676 RepID=UPI0035DA21E1
MSAPREKADAPPASPADPAVLRRSLDARPFVGVWVPSVVAVIGTGLAVFGLSWWISRAPDGGAHLGVVVALASAVSLISVLLLAGVIDSADRRRTVVTVLLVLAAPLLALLYLFGLSPGGTFAVTVGGLCYVLVYSLQQIYMAAVENIGADLAPPSWPAARTALLTQIHPQVARVLAPLAAGALLAYGSLRWVSLVALVCTLLALAAVPLLAKAVAATPVRKAVPKPVPKLVPKPVPKSVPDRPDSGTRGSPVSLLRGVWRDAAGSLRLIRSHPELVFLVFFGALGNLIVFPFSAVLPAFNAEYGLSTSAQAALYSTASSAYGVGMLVGCLVLVRVPPPAGARASLRLASIAFALILLVLLVTTIAPWPATVVLAMAVTGGLFSILVAVGGALWLRLTPAAIRVRVFSLRRLTVFSTIPVGSMLMGIGGSVFGYRVFIRGMVAFTLVALALLWARYRRTASADLTPPVPTPPVPTPPIPTPPV